jgi:hypothetical protein
VKIQATIPPSLYVHQSERLDPGEREEELPEALTPDGETSLYSPDSIKIAEDDDQGTDATRGVLRLLQEGHFKGVADVRLRINFFDELKAMEQTQTDEIVGERIDSLLESVTSVLKSGELPETPLDAYIDPFEQAIQESKEDFLAAEVRSTSILMSDLESAAETLVLSLTQVLASTAAEDPVAKDVPADVETDGNIPVSDLITKVRAAFSTAMDDLTKALSGAAILPVLSEPNGNGVAYDKFLSIYHKMQTSQAPLGTTSSTDRLDTSA